MLWFRLVSRKVDLEQSLLSRKPWQAGSIPYGHGNLFKLDGDTDRNPHFSIKNSVFLGQHNVNDSRFNFPHESLIDACENVTVVWLGDGSFPGRLPTSKFPGCVTILKGQAGLNFWKVKVADWHERHPNVGAGNKPTDPGTIIFPRIF